MCFMWKVIGEQSKTIIEIIDGTASTLGEAEYSYFFLMLE
jgi:hypothetical protein